MDVDIYAASDDISYMYLLPMKVVLSFESLSEKDNGPCCSCQVAILFLK
jgi:hypothetical protein